MAVTLADLNEKDLDELLYLACDMAEAEREIHASRVSIESEIRRRVSAEIKRTEAEAAYQLALSRIEARKAGEA